MVTITSLLYYKIQRRLSVTSACASLIFTGQFKSRKKISKTSQYFGVSFSAGILFYMLRLRMLFVRLQRAFYDDKPFKNCRQNLLCMVHSIAYIYKFLKISCMLFYAFISNYLNLIIWNEKKMCHSYEYERFLNIKVKCKNLDRLTRY